MITLFYARYGYVNPGMPALLRELTRRRADGFRAVDVTPHSADELRRLAGESTVVVIDQSVENAATWARADEYSVYYIVDQKPNSFYEDVRDMLLTAPARRFFIGYFDLHDRRLPAMLERLRGRVDGLAWMFEKQPVRAAEVPHQYRDPWLTEDDATVDMWKAVRDTFPVRVEMPFALTADEFVATDVSPHWDACVAGADYATRRVAQRALIKADLSLAPYRFVAGSVNAATRALSWVIPTQAASAATIRMRQLSQAAIVRRSRVNFVCGSALAYPVRKFFEVPAARSAMLAYPCVGFADYGFVDGVNSIVTVPEDAGKAAQRILRDDALRDRLVAGAWDTVRALHSVDRRATEFVECLGRFSQGRLRNAQYVAGEFEID